jgi:hypothetical protein
MPRGFSTVILAISAAQIDPDKKAVTIEIPISEQVALLFISYPLIR